jgi:hypothetical protein
MIGAGALIIDSVEEGRDQRRGEAQGDEEEEEEAAEAPKPGSNHRVLAVIASEAKQSSDASDAHRIASSLRSSQ